MYNRFLLIFINKKKQSKRVTQKLQIWRNASVKLRQHQVRDTP